MTGKPYDEYLTRVVASLKWLPEVHPLGMLDIPEFWVELESKELRSLLADAWLSGLAYSLNLIEEEKGKRNVQSS